MQRATKHEKEKNSNQNKFEGKLSQVVIKKTNKMFYNASVFPLLMSLGYLSNFPSFTLDPNDFFDS